MPTAPEPVADPLPEGIEHRFLAQVRMVLQQRYTDPDFDVEALAAALHLSRSQLFRKVKALTGETPTVLLRAFRLHKARVLLRQGGRTVSEVAYGSGFSSPSYFSDVYLQVFGQRPSEDAER